MTASDADKTSGHGKDSDMKMRLVPSEATEEMRDAAQEAVHSKISENGATRAVNAAIDAAPHAGKVSAEMLEAAKVRVRDNFRCGASVDGETVYCNDERLPANIRCQSCECGDVARAVLEAIGLEVEG